jgi:nicotinate-nucleotide adenylyltransferase
VSGGLALFGGAFNPPHLTHKRIIAAAKEQLPVARVLVLPAGAHPHKQTADNDMAPAASRLELCQLAFGAIPHVTIDDRELRRQGLSYTIDTLRELRAEHPDTTLFWIIGSDNLPLLNTWREPETILELCTLVTCERQGHALSPSNATHAVINLDIQPDRVSASAIRDALRAGQTPDGLDPRVLDRIRQLGLFGT